MLSAGATVGIADLDPTVVLGDVGDLDISAERGARVGREVVTQQLFEIRLIEHVGLREPMDLVGSVAVKLREHAHIPVKQSQAASRPGDCGELVGDPEPGDDSADFVVEMDSPRLRVDAVPPVEHEAFDAVLGEQCGCRDTRRSGADDDHRHFFGHGYRTALR